MPIRLVREPEDDQVHDGHRADQPAPLASRDAADERVRRDADRLQAAIDLSASMREVIRDVVREELAARDSAPVASSVADGAPASDYIDDRALAAWIGVSRETVQQMRCRAEGPPFVRVARRAVRYYVPDVRAWLASKTRGARKR